MPIVGSAVLLYPLSIPGKKGLKRQLKVSNGGEVSSAWNVTQFPPSAVYRLTYTLLYVFMSQIAFRSSGMGKCWLAVGAVCASLDDVKLLFNDPSMAIGAPAASQASSAGPRPRTRLWPP